eukprot:TRINITY_DN10129_c0_g1_i1.p1 TRINITY_DN10129_c0_g1~~TRINITY_DN10129_c0_g1_i1.p1  ORF type:complete len:170 (-),score=42.50 TRINITY_DN10129_c0_g1_i1:14-487(-)
MNTTSSSKHTEIPCYIRIVEAKGLYHAKLDSVADPFIRLKLKGLKHILHPEKKVTEIVWNNSNPIFNSDFVLHPCESDIIVAKVMDKHGGLLKMDRRLGKAFIDVKKYRNLGVKDIWLPIEGRNSKSGELHIMISAGNGAMPFSESQTAPPTVMQTN